MLICRVHLWSMTNSDIAPNLFGNEIVCTGALSNKICDSCNYARQTNVHTHSFNSPFSGTTWVSQYQKGKTNLDFTETRDTEWQRHQLGHMQVCNSLQTDNHASTPPLSFLQAG